MESRWSRVLRGVGAATVATAVAATSHGLAGGTAPGVAGVSLALSFSVLVSVALAGRGLSIWRLSASILLSQLAFHVVFSTLGGAGEVISHGHHGTMVITSGADAVTHASLGMWLGHAAAALLTIVALRFGERGLLAVHTALWMLLAAVVSAPVIHTPAFARDHRPPTMRALVPRAVRDFVESIAQRGPPATLRSA